MFCKFSTFLILASMALSWNDEKNKRALVNDKKLFFKIRHTIFTKINELYNKDSPLDIKIKFLKSETNQTINNWESVDKD